MSGPTNVEVHGLSDFHARAAVGWKADGARYHVWFDVNTLKLQDPILYKNSIADYRQPGHFNTRKLDATITKNAATIAAVFNVIKRDGLLDAAKEAKAEEEHQKKAARQEAIQAELIRAAAPELLAACKRVESWLVAVHSSSDDGVLTDMREEHPGEWKLIDMLRTALAKAGL